MSHSTGFPYTTGPGGGRPDYSNAPQRHDDPLSLHQALGQAVEEAQGGIDDSGFITDLPLLKSKFTYLIISFYTILIPSQKTVDWIFLTSILV